MLIQGYTVNEELGEGRFSNVYSVVKNGSLKPTALKIFKDDGHSQNCVDTEVEILKKLDHPHIIKILADFDYEDYRCVELELAKTDIFEEIITRNPKKYPLYLAIDIMKQLLSAVKYIHKQGYIHRDIKLENIVRMPNGTIKLIDFNLAVSLDDANGWCGSIHYSAPEMWKDGDYDHRVDIWSLGVVMYVFVIGHLPFNAVSKNKSNEVIEVQNAVLLKYPKFKKPIPPYAKLLIEAMLSKNPDDRPSIDAILSTIDPPVIKID